MTNRKAPAGDWNYCALLQALYDNEINWTIAAFHDGGFIASLGGPLDDQLLEEVKCDSLIDAAEALRAAALEFYPNSEFARRHRPS